ncbi:MAG TPA: helix-turn-helix domain-containing protein [Alphaproteobacteria bacterium]|nr:helix-turn-helix domain-containing protein [Alphaproteobacteria bacterium]
MLQQTKRAIYKNNFTGERCFMPNQQSQSFQGFIPYLEKKLQNFFAAHTNLSDISNLHELIVDEVEKTLLKETLKATKNNQKKAAEVLGINRNTLRKKVLGFSIDSEE